MFFAPLCIPSFGGAWGGQLCILHYALCRPFFLYKNAQKHHPKITQNIELLVVCPKTKLVFA